MITWQLLLSSSNHDNFGIQIPYLNGKAQFDKLNFDFNFSQIYAPTWFCLNGPVMLVDVVTVGKSTNPQWAMFTHMHNI